MATTKTWPAPMAVALRVAKAFNARSEEHTSELQSRLHLVCRLLLEKKKRNNRNASKVSNTVYGDINGDAMGHGQCATNEQAITRLTCNLSTRNYIESRFACGDLTSC